MLKKIFISSLFIFLFVLNFSVDLDRESLSEIFGPKEVKADKPVPTFCIVLVEEDEFGNITIKCFDPGCSLKCSLNQ